MYHLGKNACYKIIYIFINKLFCVFILNTTLNSICLLILPPYLSISRTPSVIFISPILNIHQLVSQITLLNHQSTKHFISLGNKFLIWGLKDWSRLVQSSSRKMLTHTHTHTHTQTHTNTSLKLLNKIPWYIWVKRFKAPSFCGTQPPKRWIPHNFCRVEATSQFHEELLHTGTIFRRRGRIVYGRGHRVFHGACQPLLCKLRRRSRSGLAAKRLMKNNWSERDYHKYPGGRDGAFWHRSADVR